MPKISKKEEKSRKKQKISYSSIFLRYLIILLAAFNSLFIFYFIFTPLTLYPVFFLSKIFFNATLTGNTIIANSFNIQIIDACVAGAAYYLLLILNLSTPNLKLKTRIKGLLFSFILLLLLNIIRIFILIILLFSFSSIFDITHKFFWYFLSTIFVILLWFLEVKLFNIKDIPFYSDIKILIKGVKRK